MNVIKKIYYLIFTFIALFIVSLSVEALSINEENSETNYKLIIEDDANLLTSSEIDSLKELMYPLTTYGNIAFKTIDSNSTSTPNYASNYYHDKFNTDSGTLFLIDMDNRIIYIFSDGANYNIITRAKAELITDNIYKYATRGEYFECAKLAFSQVQTLLEGGKISEPMRYISNILISLTSAFIICFVIVLKKTSIKSASDKEILKNCDILFNVNNVKGTLVGTHRVYSPQSDSSSSSGGGGGGSSGGGGGHSF